MPSKGLIIRASDRIPTIVTAQASADTTLGAEADLTGVTVTFTTANANVKVMVKAQVDVDFSGASATTGTTCYLNVDGTNTTGQVVYVGTTTAQRASVHQCWVVNLAAAGSHTLKIRGTKYSGTMTANAHQTHTSITCFVLDRA